MGFSKLVSILMCLLVPLIAYSGGGESSGVGNGGGPAEQAIVSAAVHFSSLSTACQLHPDCGKNAEIGAKLSLVRECALPSVHEFLFTDQIESPFARTDDKLMINRKLLYPLDRPLSFSSATAYLTRIYFELCAIQLFDMSGTLVAPFAKFTEFEGEQATIGKDTLNLPKTEWIRVRTLYSDLLIESAKHTFRLHCNEDTLDSCTVIEDALTGANSKFRNLSVSREVKEIDGFVSFDIEGLFKNKAGQSEKVLLSAIYKDGVAQEVRLQGRILELPKSD